MKIIGVVILCVLGFPAAYRAVNTFMPGDIKPLKGTAPYGVEKRPMPDGLVIDELLPKQVGPYTRMSLEKSEHRGVTPTSIDVNGEIIYAIYKVGSKEVLVEFSVSSGLETAQENLAMKARNTIRKFPKDPRVGSISTEPSYLKIINTSGAFFGWTRGRYYFSGSAKGGEADLDAFVEGFPY